MMKAHSKARASRGSITALPARKLIFMCNARQFIERAIEMMLYKILSIDIMM